MTPAIYTIMMRINFRRTKANNDPDTINPKPLPHLAHSASHEPINRRVFDGIRNVMQLKQSGMCGSCK